MDTPKPQAPKRTTPETETPAPAAQKDEKKPFVHKPHLTHRPFADNAAFARLGSKHTSNPKAQRQR